ncbi:hypothetical protein RvY_03462 [Ramazzottius varieornatus]|uniref:Uncharacterized protein n=1 Tax=Ramazzottius varieornatus TaxID=947166 RepID=A0A1D1UN46_RAMVA|nr:hypothetical protein RvY_03462 [Ramazzottius varieornatus]
MNLPLKRHLDLAVGLACPTSPVQRLPNLPSPLKKLIPEMQQVLPDQEVEECYLGSIVQLEHLREQLAMLHGQTYHEQHA